MKITYLNPRKLNQFEEMKKYTLYKETDRVYKISYNSEKLMIALNKYEKQIPNTALALELLYDIYGYYGFVMKYYENIEILSKVFLYDNIDYSMIIREVIQTLKKLEELNILYYDITEKNIVLCNKQVLFLDMDGCINSNITYENIKWQRQMLLTFLLLLPMDEMVKNKYRIRINELLDLACKNGIFNKCFLEYMCEMQKADAISYYPIDFIDELSNLDKIKYLELKLK